MLTARGWALVAASAVMAVLGRLLEVVELLMTSMGALALVALGLAYVRAQPVRLVARRHLRPPRLHAGQLGRVELIVHNAGSRRSPLLLVHDPFDHGRRSARFTLAPLEPGEAAAAAYRAPTEQRGAFELGPLELRLVDPFGLAVFAVSACPVTTLVVYPRVELVEAPPASQGDLARPTTGRRSTLAVAGEEFYALRDYQLGDDLRRVHWKATAKRDNLMIRQEETARQGRATVLLDLRHQVHSPSTLEAAVSAAASIVHACFRSQLLVRLSCSDGTDSGFGSGTAHIDAILVHLASAVAGEGPPISTILSGLSREASNGSLTVVSTGGVEPDELTAVATARWFTTATIVLIHSASAPPLPALGGASVVMVGEGQPLAGAWESAVRLRSSRPGR